MKVAWSKSVFGRVQFLVRVNQVHDLRQRVETDTQRESPVGQLILRSAVID